MRSTTQNLLLLAIAVLFCNKSQGQKPVYKGLLWEISGNGLTKPSYLYGTMHVSGKVAFSLGDSFFVALKNVDAVALETNPANWLEEFMSTSFIADVMGGVLKTGEANNEYISPDAFALFKEQYARHYIVSALSKDPEILNSLMFRKNGNDNFEEYTYLDMYIFQTANRLRKQVLSLENLDESVKLLMESASDMYDENAERDPSVNFDKKLEDAYRQADLDLMDSLMLKQGFKESYYEKLLYARNRNMLAVMDSVMHIKPLFSGVGASHLPGNKGLISLLRARGYTVRPVAMGPRNAKIRRSLDKSAVPLVYNTMNSPDGRISVDVPGRMTHLPGNEWNHSYLYPDMANGSFYWVNRISTYAAYMGRPESYTLQSIDSLLYENIPGDIISKKEIVQDGHPAFDITNRTRTGDLQRYRIVVLPHEVIFFKASGKGDYIQKNAAPFFSSIHIRDQSGPKETFTTKGAGFSMELSEKPVANFERTALNGFAPLMHTYQSQASDGTQILVLRQAFQQLQYMEEDTIELNNIDRGFTSGLNMPQQSRRFLLQDGYPALEAAYSWNGGSMLNRYFIRGPYAYVVSAAYRSNDQVARETLNSFRFTDITPDTLLWTNDTTYHFKVLASVRRAGELDAHMMRTGSKKGRYEASSEELSFSNAVTGEKIRVWHEQLGKYDAVKDSSGFWDDKVIGWLNTTDDYVVKQKKYSRQNGAIVLDLVLADTNSSRLQRHRVLLRGNQVFYLSVPTDSIRGVSASVNTFFQTFEITDTAQARWPFENAGKQFLSDLLSSDSATYAEARQAASSIDLMIRSYKPIAETISKLREDEHTNEIRNSLIRKIGYTGDKQAVAYLRTAYEKASDDNDLQLAVLNALVNIKTAESYRTFRELIVKEPPFLSEHYKLYEVFVPLAYNDSLRLAATLFPELLQLASHDEYKLRVYSLLRELNDSSRLAPGMVKNNFTMIMNDARKELKRELSAQNDAGAFYANYDLEVFNALLVPFYSSEQQVKEYFMKQVRGKNPQVKMQAIMALLRGHKPVEDTVLYNLAANELTRFDLYRMLSDAGMLHKFPAAFNNQRSLVTAAVKNATRAYQDQSEPAKDTVLLLAVEPAYFNGKTGLVYFFKYRNKPSEGWKTYLSGLQPADTAKFSFDAVLSGQGVDAFAEDKPVQQQLIYNLAYRRIEARRTREPADEEMPLEAPPDMPVGED